MSAPLLHTERLLLRPPRQEDFEPWAAWMRDPLPMATLGGPQPPPCAWRQLLLQAGAWSLQGFGMFSVLERDTGRWVGRIGPWRPAGWPGNEIGWGVIHEVQGLGYAYEAAVAAIDWSIAQLGWQEFVHCIAPGNERSERLALRLGSQPLHTSRLPLPGEPEVRVWGQTAATWRARRNSKA